MVVCSLVRPVSLIIILQFLLAVTLKQCGQVSGVLLQWYVVRGDTFLLSSVEKHTLALIFQEAQNMVYLLSMVLNI